MIQELSGQVQDLSGDLHQRFDQLQGARLSAPTDSVTQKAHTDHAEEELAKILLLRAFGPDPLAKTQPGTVHAGM